MSRRAFESHTYTFKRARNALIPLSVFAIKNVYFMTPPTDYLQIAHSFKCTNYYIISVPKVSLPLLLLFQAQLKECMKGSLPKVVPPHPLITTLYTQTCMHIYIHTSQVCGDLQRMLFDAFILPWKNTGNRYFENE